MKYCSKCGVEVSDTAEFCYNCGEKLEMKSNVEIFNDFKSSTDGVKERSIIMAIILTVLTCGIYSIYWMIKINDDALTLTKEEGPSGVVVFLLSLVTCGLYGYYWAYKMGVCVDKMKENSSGTTGVLFLLISVCGLSIVNYALAQDAINNTVR